MNKLASIFILGLFLCTLSACGSSHSLQLDKSGSKSNISSVELFNKGLFSQAYASFKPRLQTAPPDPEAIFYILIIKRNGLDGQPYNYPEVQNLWGLLIQSAPLMRAKLHDRDINVMTPMAYRTALAQIEYFGLQHPSSWPPPVMSNKKKEFQAAFYQLAIPLKRNFKPALNFSSYLWQSPDRENKYLAFKEVAQAATSGDHLAMCNLSWLFREGIGVEKNNLRAAHWARMATESSPPVPRCQNELGYDYEKAIGVTQDLSEAKRWYEKSATQGNRAGQINFNRLKNKSSGTPVLESSIMF